MITIEQREKIAAEIFENCLDILRKKGADYSSLSDSLSNFKEGGAMIGRTKYEVWAIYFFKHVKSILNSIKSNPKAPQTESEPLRGRIEDIINYSVIFAALLREDELEEPLPF